MPPVLASPEPHPARARTAQASTMLFVDVSIRALTSFSSICTVETRHHGDSTIRAWPLRGRQRASHGVRVGVNALDPLLGGAQIFRQPCFGDPGDL